MASSRGMIKFGSRLKELRIHLCQKSNESQGVRNFIEKYYVPLKQSNPQFPILIRECSGVQPKVYARYDFGKEDSVPLSNMKDEEVLKTIQNLASK
ncbi:NADH dehydrogenase [ubiquinone] 1 alpha subcomplex subunit 2-like [Centruroides sculpturatus]|uniref:NADH dehydrogenase [ubiquinone] 1 alpha subcomplex subunit 2-like n=1 Tax=Centruroides sculpturatus TaxID=218467 RepID=UPI000C6DC776|nr:NADH dehydrogenase [ubiquinone] 1 alpha subcomplex subunit 2-like [Centruroides sculpturatus]